MKLNPMAWIVGAIKWLDGERLLVPGAIWTIVLWGIYLFVRG